MSDVPEDRTLRPKHVVNVARWRVAWRVGRYHTGIHNKGHGYGWTGALPFVWYSVIRRDKP